MSMNISKAIMDVSDVQITTHINRLGRNQKIAFERALKTGIMTSGGLPAQLAFCLRDNYNLPTLSVRRGEIIWKHLENNSEDMNTQLFTAIGAGIVAAMLDLEPPAAGTPHYARWSYDNSRTRLESAKEKVDRRATSDAVWVGTTRVQPVKTLLRSRKFKLQEWTGDVPETIILLMTQWGQVTSARLP